MEAQTGMEADLAGVRKLSLIPQEVRQPGAKGAHLVGRQWPQLRKEAPLYRLQGGWLVTGDRDRTGQFGQAGRKS